MKLRKVLFLAVVLSLVLCFSAFFPSAVMTEESRWEQLGNNTSGVMVVAYRGYTEAYPPNSSAAVEYAFIHGADMVSVSVQKTKDGVLVLCEDENLQNICDTELTHISEMTYEEFSQCKLFGTDGVLTDYTPVTLKELLEETVKDGILILDIDREDKDLVYSEVVSCTATERVLLRFEENSKDIVSWVKSKSPSVSVMGIYDGGIIWNTVSHLNRLSEVSPVVQYESKNYFNVMFEELVTKNYSSKGKARAAISMYDPDLCGQRNDNATGWNEVISKGFSIIESNNYYELIDYVKRLDSLRSSLLGEISIAANIDLSAYSDVSAENLRKAIEQAEKTAQKGIVSEDEFQQRISQIMLCKNNLNHSEGKETQKGALNVTAGKVVAAVLVGAVLLLGEIYVKKMQKEKKEKADK